MLSRSVRETAVASTAVIAFATSGAFAIWRVASVGWSYDGVFIGLIACAVDLAAITQVMPTKRRELFYLWIGLLWLCTVGLLAIGFAAGLTG